MLLEVSLALRVTLKAVPPLALAGAPRAKKVAGPAGQTAHLWPKPLSGALSSGWRKVSPAPSAPTPAVMRAKGRVTAAVPAGSVIGMAGPPIPPRGTSTAIVPSGPAVNVFVVLLKARSWLLLGSNSPQ